MAEAFAPARRHACPVDGCGWVLDVPPPVRGWANGALRVFGVPRFLVAWQIACHADHHAATTETGVDPYARGWHGAP
jgi:hypothetical protein